MTEQSNEQVEESVIAKDEFTILKERADMLNIKYSPNISLSTLRTRIQEVLEPKEEVAAPVVASSLPGTRQYLEDMCNRLVRVRITNLDPKKRGMPGEYFSVSNDVIGEYKKFIAYGSYTDAGYHIPHILYEMLKGKTYTETTVVKDSRGTEQIRSREMREFSLEVLPNLTQDELDKLAATQVASGSLQD